jgi:ADP-ribose pyrophosphatase YjhB (NUDIX family)
MKPVPTHHFVVAAIIRRGDELLLIRQRGQDDPAAYWAIPGGRVEREETVTAALVREVWEETGLRVGEIGPLAYTTWIEERESIFTRRITALVYEVTAWTGDLDLVDPDGLVQEAAFVPAAVARQRLHELPYRTMREPLLAHLGGQAPAGTLWVYRAKAAPALCISPTEAAPWQDLDYLATGTPRQRAAFVCLQQLALFADLRTYTPTLIGTVPLAVDTAQSDLDIACFSSDLDAFAAATDRYAVLPRFRRQRKEIRGVPSMVVAFASGAFDLQLFAQPLPILAQYGYRHLTVEARLLAYGGERARQAIRQLKGSGVKTEPAFARYFGLTGDPYEELWDLSLVDEERLRETVALS